MKSTDKTFQEFKPPKFNNKTGDNSPTISATALPAQPPPISTTSVTTKNEYIASTMTTIITTVITTTIISSRT